MSQLSLTERITESFTLARAQRAAETTPETVRRGVAEDLALSRQKADAAESLFDNGHPAEAIKLARESLEQALAAVTHLAPKAADDAETPKQEPPSRAREGQGEGSRDAEAKPEAEAKPDADAKAADDAKPDAEAKAADDAKPDAEAKPAAADWRTILTGRGASKELLTAVEGVLTSMRATPAPRLDEAVDAEHAAAFHRVLAARVALDREVHPSALTVAQVGAKRRNRLALVALVVIGAVVGSYFAFRRPSGTFATASAYFGNNDSYGPANVMDGNVDTEWLLPDRSSGWLEINVGPTRRIDAVSLVNACNMPHEDRATREYTIEVWSHGELARSVEGTMPFSTARNPVRHEIGVDDVERVRIQVRSWHQLGGGLAEVRFE